MNLLTVHLGAGLGCPGPLRMSCRAEWTNKEINYASRAHGVPFCGAAVSGRQSVRDWRERELTSYPNPVTIAKTLSFLLIFKMFSLRQQTMSNS